MGIVISLDETLAPIGWTIMSACFGRGLGQVFGGLGLWNRHHQHVLENHPIGQDAPYRQV